jgi:hypothetical protein
VLAVLVLSAPRAYDGTGSCHPSTYPFDNLRSSTNDVIRARMVTVRLTGTIAEPSRVGRPV